MEEKRTLRSPIVNGSFATVDKRSIDERIVQYTSKSRLLQAYSDTVPALEFPIKARCSNSGFGAL